MTSLAVIVPATDAPPTLAACLRAIEAADEPAEQLLVVDEPRGSGPAAARNAGADRVDADVVVFVDADVVVHRDAFVPIRKAFDADPGLAAVFGSYDDRPADGGVVSQFRNLLHHAVPPEAVVDRSRVDREVLLLLRRYEPRAKLRSGRGS